MSRTPVPRPPMRAEHAPIRLVKLTTPTSIRSLDLLSLSHSSPFHYQNSGRKGYDVPPHRNPAGLGARSSRPCKFSRIGAHLQHPAAGERTTAAQTVAQAFLLFSRSFSHTASMSALFTVTPVPCSICSISIFVLTTASLCPFPSLRLLPYVREIALLICCRVSVMPQLPQITARQVRVCPLTSTPRFAPTTSPAWDICRPSRPGTMRSVTPG